MANLRAGTLASTVLVAGLHAGCARSLPASEPTESEAPPSVRAERSPEEYGPGFDLAWLGSEEDLPYVDLQDDHVLWIDKARRAFLGPGLEQLTPTGFKVAGAAIGSDPNAVYSLDHGTFYRQVVGRAREVLWHAHWEIDSIRENSAAFFALLINCRACVPKQKEQVWRIPKRAGEPRLFFSTQSELIVNLDADETSLFLNVLRGLRHLRLRVAIEDGRPGRVRRFDRRTSFEPKFAESPIRSDATEFIYELGTEVYAVPKSGGATRRLADWGGDEVENCSVCGSSRAWVCIGCSRAIYWVPKTPRPVGKMIVYHAGIGLALTEEALFWVEGGDILRRPRAVTCSAFDDSCQTVIGRLPDSVQLVSSLLADAGDLYALLGDGSVWRQPQAGGPGELVQKRTTNHQIDWDLPLARSLAHDGEALYFLDFVNGDVVRLERSSGARRVLSRGFRLPRALVSQNRSVFVIAAAGASTAPRHEQRFALTELDATSGETKRRVTLPEGEPVDLAATAYAVYVAWDDGRLFRLDTTSPSLVAVFPETQKVDYRLPALRVSRLAATSDSLYFMAPGQILVLHDRARLPSVLASNVAGDPLYLVADSSAAYFGHAHQFKWEHWIELGEAPLPPR